MTDRSVIRKYNDQQNLPDPGSLNISIFCMSRSASCNRIGLEKHAEIFISS